MAELELDIGFENMHDLCFPEKATEDLRPKSLPGKTAGVEINIIEINNGQEARKMDFIL